MMHGRRIHDPYAVLGIARTATPLQVARAHRRLAKRHHPDLHDGTVESVERMRRINEAWSILSNPLARADYDRDHPSAGTAASGHWGPSRSAIQPSQPSSTRTWASWRATAAETRAARRPPRPQQPPATFRDSGWAAVVVAATFVTLLLLAIAAGRLPL
jgi:curved DNA-binding protein CbpA